MTILRVLLALLYIVFICLAVLGMVVVYGLAEWLVARHRDRREFEAEFLTRTDP